MVKLALLVGLSGVLAVGCGSFDGHECTDELRSSVVVSVLDENGTAVSGADVTFQVGKGAMQDCNAFGDSYWCGAEEDGRFTIVANKMGYEQSQSSVTVGRSDNGCHVSTKQLVLHLVPSAT